MSDVEQHYQELLAPVYTWMCGAFEQNVAENTALFESLELRPTGIRSALDLGSGSGFHSVALAQLGYQVTAVDLSPTLIQELREHAGNLPVVGIVGDIRNADSFRSSGPFDVAVCLGDTLIHLPSEKDVEICLQAVAETLVPHGRLVLGFRDLTVPLTGTDRAIPVKLDDNRLLITFLEYEPDHVIVNDLLFERDGGPWSMRKSSYRKLRLSPGRVADLLKRLGFEVQSQRQERGLTTIFAQLKTS